MSSQTKQQTTVSPAPLPKGLARYIVQLKNDPSLAQARAEHISKVEEWCAATKGSPGPSTVIEKFSVDGFKLYMYFGIFSTEILDKIQKAQTVVASVNKDMPVVKDANERTFVNRPAGNWGLSYISPALPSVKGQWGCPESMGKGVTIYVLDSDFCVEEVHPDFANRSIRRVADGPTLVREETAHGAVVSRFAAGTVSGTAPLADVVTVSKPGFAEGTVLLGLLFAMAVKDIRNMQVQNPSYEAVVCISMASMNLGGANDILGTAIDNASRLIPVVCSAGNEGKLLDDWSRLPSALPNTITVGSVGNDGEKKSSSNYGHYVNIYAPGAELGWETRNGKSYLESGTSFAAPLAAGIVACMMSEDRRLGRPTPTPAEIQERLHNNAKVGPTGLRILTARTD